MKNPIFPISIAFLLGIITASQLRYSFSIVLYLSLLVIILFFIYRKHRILSLIFLYSLVIMTGVAHFISFNELPPNHIKSVVKEEPESIFLKGVISSDPVFTKKFEYSPRIDFILKVNAFRKDSGWMSSSGLVIVKAYFGGKETFEYGEEIILEGHIMLPKENKSPGEFNYRDFLSAKRIYAVCKVGKNGLIEKVPSRKSFAILARRFLYSIKKKAERDILVNLKAPHSSVLIAMLLGKRHYLETSIKDTFAETGTMHILAISGLHVGIIALILLGFFRLARIPRRIANILVIILIFSYAISVGERASLWRASIMVSVFLFSFVINRQPRILNMLSLALIVMLWINPNYIFDAGFILSFLCLASIIWISPVIDKFLIVGKLKMQKTPIKSTTKVLFYIVKSISISLSVYLGVFPIIAYYFHILTPITILANLVAVPACFALVGLGLAALIFNIFFSKIAIFLYETIWLVNSIFLSFLKTVSKLPGSYIRIESFQGGYLFLYYVIMIAIIKYLSIKKNIA